MKYADRLQIKRRYFCRLSAYFIWIDDNERMVVQGQTFTAAGRPLRYFEVDEIAQWKKDHWMAKKLEFASIDGNNRKRHKV